MPWYKCSHCRIRRSGLDVAISDAQDTCPLCGRMLDAESDLTSLMGFRFLTNDRLRATTTDVPSLPGAAGQTTAPEAAPDALAAERWLDEGGHGARER